MTTARAIAIAALLAGCGDDHRPPAATPDGGRDDAAPPRGDGGGDGTLAERYPGDIGLQGDPAVVFVENFEAPSLSAITDRWEYANAGGLALVADVPPASSGTASLAMTAGGAMPAAADLYTRLPGDGFDRLFVRWYVNYEAGASFTHGGMWFGGYEPSIDFPFPMQGTRPAGDDRVLVAFEARGNLMDFHNYWMNMHGEGASFPGNALVHDRERVRPQGGWLCIEVMVALNTDPTSAAGGELQLWSNDTEVVHFTESGPTGYWVQEDFCANGVGDDELCEQFHPGGTPMERLELQYRSSLDLKLDHLWPQNYTESEVASTLKLDDVVVATERIGCIRAPAR